jgi:hypothetical protein
VRTPRHHPAQRCCAGRAAHLRSLRRRRAPHRRDGRCVLTRTRASAHLVGTTSARTFGLRTAARAPATRLGGRCGAGHACSRATACRSWSFYGRRTRDRAPGVRGTRLDRYRVKGRCFARVLLRRGPIPQGHCVSRDQAHGAAAPFIFPASAPSAHALRSTRTPGSSRPCPVTSYLTEVPWCVSVGANLDAGVRPGGSVVRKTTAAPRERSGGWRRVRAANRLFSTGREP